MGTFAYIFLRAYTVFFRALLTAFSVIVAGLIVVVCIISKLVNK